MATLYMRNLPDALHQQLQKIALEQGFSLSAYVQQVLEQAVEDDKLRRTRAKALTNIRRRYALPTDAPDSVAMLREIRGKYGK